MKKFFGDIKTFEWYNIKQNYLDFKNETISKTKSKYFSKMTCNFLLNGILITFLSCSLIVSLFVKTVWFIIATILLIPNFFRVYFILKPRDFVFWNVLEDSSWFWDCDGFFIKLLGFPFWLSLYIVSGLFWLISYVVDWLFNLFFWSLTLLCWTLPLVWLIIFVVNFVNPVYFHSSFDISYLNTPYPYFSTAKSIELFFDKFVWVLINIPQLVLTYIPQFISTKLLVLSDQSLIDQLVLDSFLTLLYFIGSVIFLYSFVNYLFNSVYSFKSVESVDLISIDFTYLWPILLPIQWFLMIFDASGTGGGGITSSSTFKVTVEKIG